MGFAWRGCHFRQSSMFCVTGRIELVSLGRVSCCYSFVVFNFYKRLPCGKFWMWSPCRWTLVSVFHVLTRILFIFIFDKTDKILIHFYCLASDRRLEDDHDVQGTQLCCLKWDQLNFIVIPYKIKFIRFFFFSIKITNIVNFKANDWFLNYVVLEFSQFWHKF